MSVNETVDEDMDLEELELELAALEELPIVKAAKTGNALVAEFAKEFGAGKMSILGSNERLMDIKVRSSGSLILDLALGGGYPHGRLVELRGLEKSGKTTLLNLAIAEAQRVEPDKECAIIDLEYAYNPEWAKTCGVDASTLFFSQPDTYAERVYDMIEYLLKTGRFSIIGLDSVAGLVTKGEFEQEDWDKEGRVGGASKINAMAMRKLISTGVLTNSGTTLIYINQLRDKIGGFSPYGTPTETPGGRAIKFFCSQQIDVASGELFVTGSGDGRIVKGQQLKAKVAKNKIAPPHKSATMDLYYGTGVDKISELVKTAKAISVFHGTSWLKFINPMTGEIFYGADGKEIKFNGEKKAIEALDEDIANGGDLYVRIFTVVQEILRG